MERDKNGIGNRELKKLICTTNGHELRGVFLEGRGIPSRGGQREEKVGQL